MRNGNKLPKTNGFTLAEVLITLGIIGIVAAMTMPALIANYQKKQTVTQLKKAYTELYQAIKMAEVDYGTMDSWDFADIPTVKAKTLYFKDEYLFPHLKIIKDCEPKVEGCWTHTSSLNGTSMVGYLTSTNSERYSFITNSGYSVHFWLHDSGTGGNFYVDINGPVKGPNKLGRDVFAFGLSSGTTRPTIGLIPKGIDSNPPLTREELLNDSTPYACTKTGSTIYAGMYCAAVIMNDGWEIKDDYPW